MSMADSFNAKYGINQVPTAPQGGGNLFAQPPTSSDTNPMDQTTSPTQAPIQQPYQENLLNAVLKGVGGVIGGGLDLGGSILGAPETGGVSLAGLAAEPAMAGTGASIGNGAADLIRALFGDKTVSAQQTLSNTPSSFAQGATAQLLSPVLGGLLHLPTSLMESGVNPYLEGKGMLGGLIPGAQGGVDLDQVLSELPQGGAALPNDLLNANQLVKNNILDIMGQPAEDLTGPISPLGGVDLTTANIIKRALPYTASPKTPFDIAANSAKNLINNQLYEQAPLAQPLNAAYSALSNLGSGASNFLGPALGGLIGERVLGGGGGIGGLLLGRRLVTPVLNAGASQLGKAIPYGGSKLGQGLLTLLGL